MKKAITLNAHSFAFFLLLATALQIMDSMLPKLPIFPWLRFGLSYVVILPFAIQFGWKDATGLFICRNLLSVLYGGQMLSSFLISSFAGILTFMVLVPALLKLYHKNILGLSGLAVAMAASFNVLQLVAVNFLLVQHKAFYFQLAPLLTWSVLSGIAVSLLCKMSWAGLNEILERKVLASNPKEIEVVESGSVNWAWGLILIFLLVVCFVIPGIWAQGVLAVVVGFSMRKHIWPLVFYAWPFYFYLAWFYLFQPDGVYLLGEWITREGLQNFGYYFLRTLNIILLGKALSLWLMDSPKTWFPKGLYFQGISLALPLLPSLFGMSLPALREAWGQFKSKNYRNLFRGLMERLDREMKSS